MTSVRYMGTKRALAPVVADAVRHFGSDRRVADLFAGMSTVAQALADRHSVILNDVMEFPTVFAKAHCLPGTRRKPNTLLSEIYPLFCEHRRAARKHFRQRLNAESAAIAAGSAKLLAWITTAKHVGNDARYRNMANKASMQVGHRSYRLATLYFSSGYFSTAQSIDLDAIRYAIDQLRISNATANPLLAIWMATASRVINAPGHSAQFLKPTNPESYNKIRRQMQRNVWEVFVEMAHDFVPWGSNEWRQRNIVLQNDALEVVCSGLLDDVDVIYADPPYTQDQYSRYYHVFESLLLYDYPSSMGIGRYRDDRYVSPFCHRGRVLEAFDRLFSGAKDLGIPLILSYPSDGILQKTGVDIHELIHSYFSNVKVVSIQKDHSTLGASKGVAKKETTENIFTCI